MSCMQTYCKNQKCKWSSMDNKKHDDCPICKSPVIWFFDEQESDRGDDYNIQEDDE